MIYVNIGMITWYDNLEIGQESKDNIEYIQDVEEWIEHLNKLVTSFSRHFFQHIKDHSFKIFLALYSSNDVGCDISLRRDYIWCNFLENTPFISFPRDHQKSHLTGKLFNCNTKITHVSTNVSFNIIHHCYAQVSLEGPISLRGTNNTSSFSFGINTQTKDQIITTKTTEEKLNPT